MKGAVTKRFIQCIEYLKETGGVKSYSSLAEIMGVHRQIIHDIIKQKRDVTIDMLVSLSEQFRANPHFLILGEGPSFLPQYEAEGVEPNIVYVPIAAQAGYADQDHGTLTSPQLVKFSFPDPRFSSGEFRCFDIDGDSMEPNFSATDKVLCSAIEARYWQSAIKDNFVYVVVTQTDLLLKRLTNRISEEGCLILNSDNELYPLIKLPIDQVKEIWRVERKVTRANIGPFQSAKDIKSEISKVSSSIEDLEGALTKINKSMELLIKSNRIG